MGLGPRSRKLADRPHRDRRRTRARQDLGQARPIVEPNLAACSWRAAGLAKLAIDTGYKSPAVYAWARRAGHAQVAPIKGVEGFNRSAPVVGPTHVDVTEGGKKLRRGARLWTIAVATFKSETYRYLRLLAPTDEEIAAGAKFPAGYVHLPRGSDAEWIKQLVGEQLVTVKTKRGFQPARMAEAARTQ